MEFGGVFALLNKFFTGEIELNNHNFLKNRDNVMLQKRKAS